MARRYRIHTLLTRYPWLDPVAADGLFAKHADDPDLVEADVLQMFPLDQPAAFHPQYPLPNQPPPHQVPAPTPTPTPPDLSRSRVSDELRRDALGSPVESVSSSAMQSLRKQLWDARSQAMSANKLAAQTRKSELISDARLKTEEMHRLSAYFLSRIRHSAEFRNGCIDLHGLTKDEAIQLVQWKLDDGSRKRFRVITGRGNHSVGGHAVLRPALEHYFRSRRITFSAVGDGIFSVTP